jgi:hypothetical protein
VNPFTFQGLFLLERHDLAGPSTQSPNRRSIARGDVIGEHGGVVADPGEE